MNEQDSEITYPMGAVARLTGLSPDVLRAWERRYSIVDPLRSEGGTRRYRASDVERLRLVKAAVDGGHRIGSVAGLDSSALERLTQQQQSQQQAVSPVDAVMDALDRLDGTTAERLISAQLSALGPTQFAKRFALPLLDALGRGWQERRLCIASEHLGSALLRSLLGSSLRTSASHRGAPIVVFGTPPGERHELGLLIAALTALGAGAHPLYLGTELPLNELVDAAKKSDADALAISLLGLRGESAREAVTELRTHLPSDVELWIGGSSAADVEPRDDINHLDTLERLEQRVELLAIRHGAL